MEKNKVNIVLNSVLVILALAFILVVVILFRDVQDIRKIKKTYDNVERECVSTKKKDKAEKIINWSELKKTNSDIIAWLYIPETPINYPVVKSKDNYYYLNHDIYGNYSKYGAIFFDERLYDDPFGSKNIIIYGHNMGHWTNLMFSTLLKYKDNSYYKKHKNVYVYTEKENLRLSIVSVRVVDSSSDAYNISFKEKELKKWINNVCTQSIVPIKQQDYDLKQVVTISTCTYDGKSRFVLHCVKE